MSDWEKKPVLEKVNHYLRQIEQPEAGRDHSSELHYLYRLRNELTAANAVVEAYGLVVSDYDTTGRCTPLRRENLRNKLAERRKLQGGS